MDAQPEMMPLLRIALGTATVAFAPIVAAIVITRVAQQREEGHAG